MLVRRGLIGLVLVLALIAAACGSDDGTTETTAADSPLAEAPATTEAPTTTAAPTTTEAPATTTTAAEAEFDLVAAVASYTNTIPEGYLAVGDITAFKDAVEASGALLIDIREVGEYEEGHIEGAVNIPLRTLGENLDKIPTDRQVFIYCKSGHRAGIAVSALGMLGYTNILGFPPGWNGWTEAGEAVSTEAVAGETYEVPEIPEELYAPVNEFLSTIPEGWLTAGDVAAINDAIDSGAFMLDVRTTAEYDEGYIPTAVNVNLRAIPDNLDQIPTDGPVIHYCKSGWRSAMALPVLHVLGYDAARSFTGSYKAWTEAEQPVATG
jgi:rhodanese-related sulfurtransferase